MAKNKPTETKLEFADEDPTPETAETTESAPLQTAPESTDPKPEMNWADRNKANQAAAVKAIEAMKYVDMSKMFPVQKPSLPSATAEEVARTTPKVYCVLEDRKVATASGTHVLKTGKVFNENQYNIADLKRQGVKLKEIKPST